MNTPRTKAARSKEEAAGSAGGLLDRLPQVAEVPLCQVCERRLDRKVSAAEKVSDRAIDAFFAFFEGLFSARGQTFRRVVYGQGNVKIALCVLIGTGS
jgi:hypothetical protein